jgi:uncharacterized protein DUF3810
MRRRLRAGVVAVAIAAALLPLPASMVERGYSSWLYPLLQRAITPISNLVPFALFDALWVAAVTATAVLVHRRVRAEGWKRGLIRVAATVAVFAAAGYLAFLAMWGLNYRRVPLVEKLAFDPARIRTAGARELGDLNAATLNRLYAASHPGVLSLDALTASFQETIHELGARAPIVPGRPKETLLGGYFHQISVAGMTDPFLLETLVASDLLDVERPFVIAHEWAHLAGYADESEANFVAWITCRHADATAQYSAALALIGYARPSVPVREALAIGPRIDLFAIQRRYATTNETLRIAARQGYDTYLKANRVEKGVESYDAVVQLILGTALDARGFPKVR